MKNIMKAAHLNFVTATKEKKSLVDIQENNFFSHFGIHQGVQVMSRPRSLRLVGLALLGLLTSHLVGTSLIHSAYAASYVNVSSGGGNSGTSSSETVSPGIVNLGSIKPSSTGTMATGNDTLTIHTDCPAGYKVYVSGQNGKSTNLINSNVEDPTSPTTSELISSASNLPNSTSATSSPSSAAALSSNTWGINGNNTEAGSNLYYGLPSYSDATAYPLVTKADVPEESTVPIYYGVKVNTDITPGTYTGDVLYTVIMDTSCTTYNVSFNPNVTNASDVSGTMETQLILINTTDNLIKNNFIRSGYGFLGWSTSANGKTGTVTNGIGTPNDVEYSDESEVTDLINAGQTITLYAIWAKVGGNMQSWNGCSTLSTNQIVYLTDTRDNKTYGVKKTPDGKCWMLQNLTTNGVALTPSNTNISDGRTYYLPKKNTRYPIADPFNVDNTTISSDILNASDSVDFSDTNSNQVQVGYRDKGTTNNNAGISVPETTAYYNFYTATLGFSYYNDDKSSGSSTQDICPKGWHLPWTSDAGTTRSLNAELYTLALVYNPGASWNNPLSSNMTNNTYTSDTTIRDNMIAGDAGSLDRFATNGAIGFTYGGHLTNTTIYYVGSRGLYWSSSVNSTNFGYYLYTNTTNITPLDSSGTYYKYRGSSTRCVVDNYTIQFDANGGSGSMENQIMFGTTSTALKSNTFTRAGYTFLGWSTDSSATSATYTNQQAVSNLTSSGKAITLYAIWSKASYTLTTANGNSAAINSISPTAGGHSYKYQTSVTVSCSPKSGYHCTGWTSNNTSLLPSSSNASYTFNMPAGSVTLTATGAANTYTINYNANGGSGTTNSTTVTYGTNVTLATNNFTAPSGKKFKSWCTSNPGSSSGSCSGTSYSSGQSGIAPATIKSDVTTVNGGSITLYAIWENNEPTYAGNCSDTVHPTATQSCKMADNRTWVLGNSGNDTTFNAICTNQTGAENHDATCSSCPSGYSFPTITIFDNLVQAYGGTSYSGHRSGYRESTGALYKVLGLSSSYWSSTEYDFSYAYLLRVGSSSSSSSYSSSKTYSGYVLCYK